MAFEFTTSYLADALTLFRYYKKMAEGAIGQVTYEELTTTLDGEMNSIALIVKHMATTWVAVEGFSRLPTARSDHPTATVNSSHRPRAAC
jgi:hypothetical protein